MKQMVEEGNLEITVKKVKGKWEYFAIMDRVFFDGKGNSPEQAIQNIKKGLHKFAEKI